MKQVYTSLDDFAAWELEAYADGEALPHVATFFEQHPAVWQMWRQEQQWESGLKATLHRFDCPAPDFLRAYHWHELSPVEQQQLEAHLRLCPHCTLELKNLQAFLQDETFTAPVHFAESTQQPSLWEQLHALADRVQFVVATLVTPATPQFAGVALRSDATPTLQSNTQSTLLFEAGDAAIILMVQREFTGALRLAGQLLTPTPTGEGVAKLSAAHPADDDIQMAVDTTGNFVITPLQPGNYQLVITLQAQAIVVPNLKLI